MNAPSFCSRCGQPVPVGSSFCAHCGAPVGGAPAPGTGFGPGAAAPGFGSAGTWGPPVSDAARAADLRALDRARRAAVYGIFGFSLNLTAVYLLLYESFVFSFSSDCTGPQHVCALTTSASAAAVDAYVGVYVAGVLLTILAVLALREAYLALAPIDARFRSPARLALLGPIGLVTSMAGLAVLVAIAGPIFSSCSSTPTSACYNAVHTAIGQALAPVALVLGGGLLWIVGELVVLLGVWRMGARYDDASFKVAAVLLFLPFVDVIGMILVWVGASSIGRRIAAGGGRAPIAGPPAGSPPPGSFP